MAELQTYTREPVANNQVAKKLQLIFNHGFDGQAHGKISDEETLYFNIRQEMVERGITTFGIEDVLEACRKAEDNHRRLLADRPQHLAMANEAVYRLFDRFCTDLGWQNEPLLTCARR